MMWADLRPGDVLMNDSGDPVILVIRCDATSNLFAWMPFRGKRVGIAIDVDLEMSWMWGEDLGRSYTLVLRGNEELRL